ncbi:MAG: hypothetical protein A3K19_33340 [Lentisphaerae bacterium RIFOXYB12_FULL_65_16]|nr:MAG: hypothetical protein A3K18_05825 [Lentisphaerae bacterium RIFOXYA12_64_32]OGV86916.1 MAG: hypothetical protein A3K19_33340 [Lentisphaerae bacterium RIFOXYB12_FULL_65_16]
MSDITREVLREVDRLQDELVELCRALVWANTVNPYAGGRITGLERSGQDVLEPVMQGLGGRTRRFEPPPDIYRRADAEANERAGKGWNGMLVREQFAAAVAVYLVQRLARAAGRG